MVRIVDETAQPGPLRDIGVVVILLRPDAVPAQEDPVPLARANEIHHDLGFSLRLSKGVQYLHEEELFAGEAGVFDGGGDAADHFSVAHEKTLKEDPKSQRSKEPKLKKEKK